MKAILITLIGLIVFAACEYPAPGSSAYLNDNNVLQYALSLELLEANFYTQGLQRFNSAAFNAAGYTNEAYSFLQIIQSHEVAHSTTIQGLLAARGATPVMACNYTFPYTNVREFLQVASALEAAGISAYDGAITTLTQTDLVTLASTVSSVEGRHAAYINLLIGSAPFTNAADTPLSKAQIASLAINYINGTCMDFTRVGATPLYNATQLRPSNITNPTLLSAAYENDNNVLRFALTLERTETAFFTAALANISQATFAAVTSAAASNFSGSSNTSSNNSNVYNLYSIIRDHEIAHVAILTALLNARNATIPPACTNYLFAFNDTAESVLEFIMESYMLETIGLEAFLGSSMLVTDPAITLVAATFITVEGRHVSFERALMDKLNGGNGSLVPFPNVTDIPATPEEVLTMVSAYVDLDSCPNITLPVPADTFRSNYTFVYNASVIIGSTTGSGSSGTASSGTASSGTGSSTGSSASNSGTNSATITNSNSNSQSNQDSSAESVMISLCMILMLAMLF